MVIFYSYVSLPEGKHDGIGDNLVFREVPPPSRRRSRSWDPVISRYIFAKCQLKPETKGYGGKKGKEGKEGEEGEDEDEDEDKGDINFRLTVDIC